MPKPAAATALCRVLLALARARATGVVRLQGQGRDGAIALADGRLAGVAISGEASRCLGEVLDDLGAWDCLRHGQAVREGMPPSPIGAWLVSSGVSTKDAVVDALEQQLHERLTQIAMWERASFAFDPHLGGCGVTLAEAPLGVHQAVWVALGVLAKRTPQWRVRSELGTDRFQLNEEGTRFAALDRLTADQRALFALLARGARVKDLVAVGHDEDARRRELWALKLVGATCVAPAAYGLLLKKRREVQRNVPAHLLLEVPERPSPPQARRALRRLVRDLHPDRFGRSASSWLKRASNDVVSALVRAEAQLRSS